ncbi:MAG: hypothetical protein AAF415_15750 [Pseudomonadota bacterium]
MDKLKSMNVVDLVRDVALARPIDRFGLMTLLSSLYFFQYWGLALNDFKNWPYDRDIVLVLILISAIGIVLPRLYLITLVNSGFYVGAYLINAPIASNNQTCAAFVSLVILAGTMVSLSRMARAGGGVDFRESVFQAISGPGRYLLAIMYFYGIYHKINTDFLNPIVSCAVVLYRPLAEPFGLDEWSLGQYSAIYATFVIEGIAMILLFSPRYKRLGMLIGIPFHIMIGWTGYAYYKDFSTVVLVMYAMFLPREAIDNAIAFAGRYVGGPVIAANIGRWVVIGLFAAYLASVLVGQGSTGLEPTHEGFTWFFTIYALAFLAFCVAFVPMRMSDPLTDLAIRPAWLAIFPIVFFVNGASPYLGLKTESSIAMFSNLYTERGETNHLIHGQLPFAADYQNDIVTPVSSSSEAFDGDALPGHPMIRYEFDRLLDRHAGVEAEFLHNGTPRSLDANWTNTYQTASLLERMYFIFKPLEQSRPQECTH